MSDGTSHLNCFLDDYSLKHALAHVKTSNPFNSKTVLHYVYYRRLRNFESFVEIVRFICKVILNIPHSDVDEYSVNKRPRSYRTRVYQARR